MFLQYTIQGFVHLKCMKRMCGNKMFKNYINVFDIDNVIKILYKNNNIFI